MQKKKKNEPLKLTKLTFSWTAFVTTDDIVIWRITQKQNVKYYQENKNHERKKKKRNEDNLGKMISENEYIKWVYSKAFRKTPLLKSINTLHFRRKFEVGARNIRNVER